MESRAAEIDLANRSVTAPVPVLMIVLWWIIAPHGLARLVHLRHTPLRAARNARRRASASVQNSLTRLVVVEHLIVPGVVVHL